MRGAMRSAVLAILLLGMVGTAAELLLIGHDEDARQLIPLGLIGVALSVLVWHRVRPGPSVIRAFQMTMAFFVVGGVVGIVLHYRGNAEFQREIDPSIKGLDLFWKVMRAKAPPALAPGTMVELGLLGLLYAFRHPALEGASDETPMNGE